MTELEFNSINEIISLYHSPNKGLEDMLRKLFLFGVQRYVFTYTLCTIFNNLNPKIYVYYKIRPSITKATILDRFPYNGELMVAFDNNKILADWINVGKIDSSYYFTERNDPLLDDIPEIFNLLNTKDPIYLAIEMSLAEVEQGMQRATNKKYAQTSLLELEL